MNTLGTVGEKEQRFLIERAQAERRNRIGFRDSLSFFGTEFDDEGLSILAGLRPDLKGLFLMQSRVGEDGLASIAYFHELEILHLDRAPVTNRAAMRLGTLTHLRDLSIDYTEIGDTGLTALIALPLHRLSARRTGISDGSASLWPFWSRLESVYLNDTFVGDETAKALATLPNLREVGLNHTWVTNEGLLALSRSNLRYLFLSDTEVDDTGVAALAEHPTLEALSLDRCRITDRSVEILQTLPNLEYLDIAGTDITDMGPLIATPRFGS